MFIKTSKLSQVLKKAYKGAGIHLERQGSRLIVATACMYIEADTVTMTNAFKAAIITFAGELPESGTAITITEDMEQNNIPKSYDRRLFTKDLVAGKQFNETAFTYNDDTVLQAADGALITVPAKEWAVYSLKDTGESEDDPDGWFEDGTAIACRNSTMIIELSYNMPDDTLSALQEKRLI